MLFRETGRRCCPDDWCLSALPQDLHKVGGSPYRYFYASFPPGLHFAMASGENWVEAPLGTRRGLGVHRAGSRDGQVGPSVVLRDFFQSRTFPLYRGIAWSELTGRPRTRAPPSAARCRTSSSSRGACKISPRTDNFFSKTLITLLQTHVLQYQPAWARPRKAAAVWLAAARVHPTCPREASRGLPPRSSSLLVSSGWDSYRIPGYRPRSTASPWTCAGSTLAALTSFAAR